MITQDWKRYGNAERKSGLLRTFLTHPGFRFMVIYRLCNQYSIYHPFGLAGRLWYRRLKVKFGFQIPHKTNIGAGFFLGHFGGIVINPGTKIGANCNVAQGVTIGQENRGQRKGVPTIGDRVWIGPNAVVVGRISIGNDVLIAPLTYVNFDVPDNAVVIGNPGAIINYTGSAGYVNNIL